MFLAALLVAGRDLADEQQFDVDQRHGSCCKTNSTSCTGFHRRGGKDTCTVHSFCLAATSAMLRPPIKWAPNPVSHVSSWRQIHIRTYVHRTCHPRFPIAAHTAVAHAASFSDFKPMQSRRVTNVASNATCGSQQT